LKVFAFIMTIEIALFAITLEALLGYPHRLFASIGHPVMWMGQCIKWLDIRLNRARDALSRRKVLGVVALVVLLGVIGGGVAMLEMALRGTPWGLILLAPLASSLLAQRSLHDHVAHVADALDNEGVEGGRFAVSRIVGRDTQDLDEAAISRAAIESLAENFSDGVVAPIVWIVAGGLTGGVLYKLINTADSMIGHRTPRYEAFGWAAARLDDLVNLPASRLSAAFLATAAVFMPNASAKETLRTVWRDARHHRSPNAGYPEAAIAGALGVSLAGSRQYEGVWVEDVFMGNGRREVTSQDVRTALALYRRALMVQTVVLGIAAMVWIIV
jgi:adenosylcobinamide-phosphate synthase